METQTPRSTHLPFAYAQSQKGFAILYTLIILPLCIVCMVGFNKVGQVIQHSQKMHSFCRLLELKYQNLLGYELKALMRLNRPARRLQTQYTRTRKALAAAVGRGDFGTAGALKLRLAQIKQQQLLLSLQQKRHFQRVQTLNIQKQQSLSRIRPHLQHNVNLRFSPLRLAVKAEPPGALAPVYKEQLSFARQQQTYTWWRIEGLHIAGRCGASLLKESQRWKAVLLN